MAEAFAAGGFGGGPSLWRAGGTPATAQRGEVVSECQVELSEHNEVVGYGV